MTGWRTVQRGRDAARRGNRLQLDRQRGPGAVESHDKAGNPVMATRVGATQLRDAARAGTADHPGGYLDLEEGRSPEGPWSTPFAASCI